MHNKVSCLMKMIGLWRFCKGKDLQMSTHFIFHRRKIIIIMLEAFRKYNIFQQTLSHYHFAKTFILKNFLAQNISPKWKICQVKITYHETISEWISYSKCLFKNDYLQLYFDGDPGLAYFMCITPFYYNVIL